MNRVWDYIGFAVWFAGLGYIAMWLFGTPGQLALSPGLHAVGVASAMFVPVRLLLRAVAAHTAVRPRMPATVLRPPWRKPARRRPVKPRSHFGLRGMPD